MSISYELGRLGAIALACAVPAAAYADTSWKPAQCGAEPDAPGVSSADVKHYNDSVDAVQSYEKAARAYNDCANKHAQAEERAVSDEARVKITHIQNGNSDIQKRIAAHFTALTKALGDGAKKLGNH